MKTGRRLNLLNPSKLSEKIQWLKLFNRSDLLAKCTDKFMVRDYVSKAGLENHLVQLYLKIDCPSQLVLDDLPDSFVVKANHTSGSVLLVNDKSKISMRHLDKILREWLSIKYWRSNREWAYKKIKPCIIFEELLVENGQKSLLDYKIHCFHGKVKFIEVMSGRASAIGVREKLYDCDWQELPFQFSYPDSHISHARPHNLSAMIRIAETLSLPFPYVRVDLYIVKSLIYFGELTFYPHSGWDMYYLYRYPELDVHLGKMLDLTSLKLK